MKKNLLFLSVLLFFSVKSMALAAVFQTSSLTEQEQERMQALSKMYGYARYFTPVDYTKDVDWLRFLMYAIPKVNKADTPQELQQCFTELFEPLVPQVRFSSAPMAQPVLQPGFSGRIYVHEIAAFPLYNKSISFGKIVHIPYSKGLPIPDQPYSFQLMPGLYVHYPLAVTDSLPKPRSLSSLLKAVKQTKWQKKTFYTGVNYRIANAMLMNTIIAQFYPYWEEDGLEAKWDSCCKVYFNAVAKSHDLTEYYEVTYAHLAHVHDNHLMVMNQIPMSALFSRLIPIYYADKFSIRFVEERLFISDSQDGQLRRGDEIIAVNSVPTEEFVAAKVAHTMASHREAAKSRICYETAFRLVNTKDSVIHLTVKNVAGDVRTVPITSFSDNEQGASQSQFIREEEEGIWVVNPCADVSDYKLFADALPRMKQAKGIIIDLRGRPDGVVISILSHLTDRTLELGQLSTARCYFPDHQQIQWLDEKPYLWKIYPAIHPELRDDANTGGEKPLPEKLDVPVVFLTNARCGSFGETIMEIVKRYKLGTIVGEPTNGTNGNAAFFFLRTTGFGMTGKHFRNGDGTQHHGIGTLPDVPCSQTISDFHEGTDTMLRKGIEIVRSVSFTF